MDAITKLSFEEAYEALVALIEQLEETPPPLEESIALYERGRALTAHCQALLQQAELRITQLAND